MNDATLHAPRLTADVKEPVVCFLIGMHVHAWWRVWEWGATASAMGRMLTELFRNPDLGLLKASSYWGGRTIFLVQYWRSFEQLERYARGQTHAHLPAWKAFYARARKGQRSVGIFHETYVVGPGTVESLYMGMPVGFGLAGAVGAVPVGAGREAAKERLAG